MLRLHQRSVLSPAGTPMGWSNQALGVGDNYRTFRWLWWADCGFHRDTAQDGRKCVDTNTRIQTKIDLDWFNGSLLPRLMSIPGE